jgi:hypothetical protein
MRMTSESRMLIRYGRRWTRRIAFAHGPRQPILVSPWDLTVTRHRIDMWLRIGTLSSRGPQRQGEFFLQLDIRGRITAFEHVASDAADFENHTRHLFASDDGVWQLWLGADHAEIRKR